MRDTPPGTTCNTRGRDSLPSSNKRLGEGLVRVSPRKPLFTFHRFGHCRDFSKLCSGNRKDRQ